MAAAFNKEFLSWYLITLKLKETIESSLHNAQSPTSPESQWVISIREKIYRAHHEPSRAKICIYRVPQCVKESDEKAYIPQLVSLGPYHHSDRRLQNMDRHKWRALNHILKRNNQDIKIYLDAMKELEVKARNCYEGSIKLSSDKFVEMMVLDGCFILELFHGVTSEFKHLERSRKDPAKGFKNLGHSRNETVIAMRGSMHSIVRDMIMLENQIPMFILDQLLGLQIGDPNQEGKAAKLALSFFDALMPTTYEPLRERDTNRMDPMGNSSIFDPLKELVGLHCLEIFRRSLLILRSEEEPTPKICRWFTFQKIKNENWRWSHTIHCAVELKHFGITFKKRKADRFWDIKFKNGVLSIPCLLVHHGTKSLFLNLIMLEKCLLDCKKIITSYVIFMDNLINSAEDVSYLHHCGIIEHWLGSDVEVAELFNRLCQEVVFDRENNNYLSSTSKDINKYCHHKWNAWKASLTHKYFNSPWTIISLIAAAVLLLLTFGQTFYGVYGYHRPSA